MFMNNPVEHICMNEDDVSAISGNLPSAETLLNMCNIFNSLQSETRLKILFLLSDRELCVRELELSLGISHSAISHSLRLLRQLDLVRVKKEGRFAVYHIADEHVQQLIGVCQEHVMEK
jgi:DNA-binding transcriptional ArsR family regulator